MPSADLDALARKLEPKLARAILAALDGLRDRATLKAIAERLEQADVDGVLSLLGLSYDDVALADMHFVLRDITGRAANMVADASRLKLAFDLLNPKTVSFIRNYELNLIRQINAGTREGVRAAVQAGIVAGQNPRETARQVKQLIGLTDRQQMAVSKFRAELESFHLKRSANDWNLGGAISRAPGGAQVFAQDGAGGPLDGILSRRLRDFRYDKALARAMETGVPLTPEQIDKMVDAYTRKYLKYRAETIARTESLRASMVGAHQIWVQAIDSGKVQADEVRRKWLVAHDERTCPTCAPIPAMNPEGRGIDELFETPKGPINLPPVHPSCRCTVFYRL